MTLHTLFKNLPSKIYTLNTKHVTEMSCRSTWGKTSYKSFKIKVFIIAFMAYSLVWRTMKNQTITLKYQSTVKAQINEQNQTFLRKRNVLLSLLDWNKTRLQCTVLHFSRN